MRILVRSLEKKDMFKVISLLSTNLSPYAPKTSEYEEIWKQYQIQKHVYSVVADMLGEVVGYGTVVFETKIRGGKVGHIEDICVASKVRRKGIGGMILKELIDIALENGCYKLCLASEAKNLNFYELNGFQQKEVFMTQFIF
jgi:glucosamine-phosphate N-acetyltransferase